MVNISKGSNKHIHTLKEFEGGRGGVSKHCNVINHMRRRRRGEGEDKIPIAILLVFFPLT